MFMDFGDPHFGLNQQKKMLKCKKSFNYIQTLTSKDFGVLHFGLEFAKIINYKKFFNLLKHSRPRILGLHVLGSNLQKMLSAKKLQL